LNETHAPRQARKILREVKTRNNLAVLITSRRDDSAHGKRNISLSGPQVNVTTRRESKLAGRCLTYKAVRTVIAGRDPCAIHFPPRIHFCHLVKPGTRKDDGLRARIRGHVKVWRCGNRLRSACTGNAIDDGGIGKRRITARRRRRDNHVGAQRAKFVP